MTVPLSDGPFLFVGQCSKFQILAGEQRNFCGSRIILAGAGNFFKWMNGILTKPEKIFVSKFGMNLPEVRT